MDPWTLLDTWLEGASLLPSSQAEYRRDVTSWLAWCSRQHHPTVHPYHVGPEHVARWCYDDHLAQHLGNRPFDGPDDLAYLAAENPGLVGSHDRRITAVVQYYLAAQKHQLVLTPPHLYDLRSDLDRDARKPLRLNPRERHLLERAIPRWTAEHSQHHLRDQLLMYLLLNGLRPAQAVRLDLALMKQQPDLSWRGQLPRDSDGPGRPVNLDASISEAIEDYLPTRPIPQPGVRALLLSRTGRPLYSRFPNELVRKICDLSPALAQRIPPVTADQVAHTGLWDVPEQES